jgi:hypothetical protein
MSDPRDRAETLVSTWMAPGCHSKTLRLASIQIRFHIFLDGRLRRICGQNITRCNDSGDTYALPIHWPTDSGSTRRCTGEDLLPAQNTSTLMLSHHAKR